MKKRTFAILTLALATVTFLSAQDLQELLDKHFETIGQENITGVKTMVSTGTTLQMGMEMPFKFISKRPDKAYIEVDIQGAKMQQAYDGENGWMIAPWTGSAEPMDLTGPDLRGVKDMSDMDGPLWEYEKKGYTLTLEGTEDLEGTEVFILKLVKEEGVTEYYYLDSENYVVLKIITKTMVNGSEVEVEVLMSNFQEVNGYVSAFTTEQRFDGQTGMTINIETLKFDEEVDDKIFVKPVVPETPEEE
jgi:outer membrane lipoprotein-sorting protein